MVVKHRHTFIARSAMPRPKRLVIVAYNTKGHSNLPFLFFLLLLIASIPGFRVLLRVDHGRNWLRLAGNRLGYGDLRISVQGLQVRDVPLAELVELVAEGVF